MYDKGLRDNSYANLFTRVMYNPDITKSDYKFLKDKRRDFPKYVIYNENKINRKRKPDLF